MPAYNRILIQSAVMNMEKTPESPNYTLMIDTPADAQVVVEGFNPLDDTHATIQLSVVELVAQFDDEDEVPEPEDEAVN